MKKVIAMAFCLGLAFATSAVYASANTTLYSAHMPHEDEKTPVKPEELPEPVKKTLSAEEYKGWVIQSANLVKSATVSHYEVTVANDKKETKTLKFDKDGALLK